MQKLTRKIAAVLSAFILAAVMMFSPVSSSGFFRPFSGSLGVSALPIRAEEQPVTDESKGIAALLTLLFANGIRFAGEWENVSDGAVKLWNDFTTATGNTVTLAALGVGVAVAHGYMRTSATVNNAVSAFQAWYEGAFSVPSTGVVSIPVESGNTTYVPITGCVKVQGQSETSTYNNVWYSVDSTVNLVAYYSNEKQTRRQMALISNQPFKYARSSSNSACSAVLSDASASVINGVTYYIAGGTEGPVMAWNLYPINPYRAGSTVDNYVYYVYGEGASLGDISIEGQSYDLKDGYNLNNDQSLLLDIANLSALVASIGLTLDSINDLVQDWPAIFDTPWADTDVPDITFPVPIEDTPDNTIPWVNVPDAVSPDPVPDYVPDTPAGEGEYKVLGLDKVFPFSIPFDLYYLATILVAEPETPSFTYALYDPTTSSLVSQEVNLHQFDTIASLLRTLETVLFIATLIFVTRGLIRS